MTVTAPRPAPAPPAALAPASRIQPRRRRPGLAALGVLLVVLGMLGAYALVVASGTARPVLAVARPVTIGAKLTDADLQVVRINLAPGLRHIPAGQRDRVIGRYARVDLVAGTLHPGPAQPDRRPEGRPKRGPTMSNDASGHE